MERDFASTANQRWLDSLDRLSVDANHKDGLMLGGKILVDLFSYQMTD